MKQKLFLRWWKPLWISFFEYAAVNHPADSKESCGETPIHLPALQSGQAQASSGPKAADLRQGGAEHGLRSPGSWIKSKQFKVQKQNKFMSIFWLLCRNAHSVSAFPFSDWRVKSFGHQFFTAGCGVNQLLFCCILELLKEKHVTGPSDCIFLHVTITHIVCGLWTLKEGAPKDNASLCHVSSKQTT